MTEDKMVLEKWKENFQDLPTEKELRDMRLEAEQEEYDEDIQREEVTEEIKEIKSRKVAGFDDVSSELLNCMKIEGPMIQLEICKRVRSVGRIPEDWKMWIIVPICKNEDRLNCQNYRGITLLSDVGKVYQRILEERYRKNIEAQMEGLHCGFKKDHIFTIKLIHRLEEVVRPEKSVGDSRKNKIIRCGEKYIPQ